MQKRVYVVVLFAGGLLVGAFIWLMLSPNEQGLVYSPDVLAVEDTAVDDSRPLIEEFEPSLPEPEFHRRDEPPSAPKVVNDPSTGKIWLRLIDAQTNRPVANKSVQLIPTGYPKGELAFMPNEPRPSRNTDSDGLIHLSAEVVTDSGAGTRDAEVVLDTSIRQPLSLHVPVPNGWYCASELHKLGADVFDLVESASDAPLTVWVQRYASVNVVVRDRWGVPVPDAKFDLTIIGYDAPEDWISTFCTPNKTRDPDYWQYDVDKYSKEFHQGRVRCHVNGRPFDNSRFEYDFDQQYSEKNQVHRIGAGGSKLFRRLPCVGVGVFAWHPLYGSTSARLELSSGRNTMDVFFSDPPPAELRIRLQWTPSVEDLDKEIDVILNPSGPYGRFEIERHWESFEWGVKPGKQGSEIVITGLDPGWWHIAVNGDYNASPAANVSLKSGETKTVTLHMGEDSMAEWTPVIRVGGQQIEEAPIYLLGGYDMRRDDYSVFHDSESGVTDPLELSAGTWTVWVPTLPAFTFELTPGDKRRDVFEIKLLTVTITIEQELRDYLCDEETGAHFEVAPVGMWEDARDHLVALARSMREAEKDYDLLIPGQPRFWLIPPGSYEWEINGDETKLRGSITFTESGPTQMHFGVRSLPGYAALEVELQGFSSEEPADVTLSDQSNLALSITVGSNAPPDGRNSGPDIVTPDEFEEHWFDLIQTEEIFLSPGDRVLFAKPGSAMLSIWHDGERRAMVVQLPGRIVVTVNEFNKAGATNVEIIRSAEHRDNDEETIPSGINWIGYEYEFFHASGWWLQGEGKNEYRVPQGKVRVNVEREISYENGAYVSDYSTFLLIVKTDSITIELEKLNYKAAGTLDLVFTGRGSPERTTDAWWEDGGVPEPPLLYALGTMDGKQTRLVQIGGMSEFMPEGKLEFTIRNRTLPPGRYRLIPWENAPKKYWREFTLKSGQRTTITVQTE